MKANSICFTGHRPVAMPWGYNENDPQCKALKAKLKDTLKKLLEVDYDTFYNGLAEGFDLYAAEILLELKNEGYNFYLVGCIPCSNQADYYSEKNKALYNKIKASCDELYFATEGHYFKGCTHIRNKYMVDNSACIITYCHKETGGAASTLKYAEKQNLKIINI